MCREAGIPRAVAGRKLAVMPLRIAVTSSRTLLQKWTEVVGRFIAPFWGLFILGVGHCFSRRPSERRRSWIMVPPPGPRHYTGIIPSLSLPITGNSCRTVSMKLEMVSLLPSQSFNTGWAGFELRSLKFHYSGKWAHSYSEVAPNVIVWNIIVPWPGILRQKQGSISNHRELNTNYIWASLSVVGLLTRCPILDWVSICRSKDRATAISLATLDTIQLYRWSRGY